MKKINLIILSLCALCTTMFVACVDDPDGDGFPADKYFYDIPDVPVTEDYVVGVLYHELTATYWYTSQKNKPDYTQPQTYTGTPLLGDPDKNGGYYINKDFFVPLGDPDDVLGKQLAYGKQAGIDFFYVNWNGHGTDTLFLNFKNKWQPGDPKIAFIYDCNHLYNAANAKDDSLHTNISPPYHNKLETAVDENGNPYFVYGTKNMLLLELDSLKNNCFAEEFYYKLPDGTPLLGMNNYTRCRNVTETVDDVRNTIGNVYLITASIQKENGFTSLRNLQDIHNNVQYTDENKKKRTAEIYIFRENGARYGKAQMPFDAVYEPAMLTNDYSQHGYDNWKRNYYSIIDYNFKEWKSLLEAQGKDFITTAMPAFDNRAGYESNSSVDTTLYLIPREIDGAVYKTGANVAKRNTNKHRLIIINSWNHFKQGSGLEPTEEYGEDYLNFTKQYFKKP